MAFLSRATNHHTRGRCPRCGRSGKAGWMILVLLAFLSIPAWGAFVLADDSTDQSSGFSVRKFPPTLLETLEDFERYRDKQAWEKAFASLNDAADTKGNGLAAESDGILVPLSTRIRLELLSLSPEGREAFRLFNDAKAQQLYDQIVNSDDQTPTEEIAALRTIVDRYFVTSIGDRAADRLGDALFETGDFDGAANAWRLILDHYPDTSLSTVMLRSKCAIALARAGRWDQFQAQRALVQERFAGQTITLGGQSVVASDYLDAMAAGAATPTQSTGFLVSTLTEKTPLAPALPADDTPIWQMPLMDDNTSKAIQTALNQYGWGSMANQISQGVPPTVVDDKRIYVNWFGTCFAADVTSGKMLWRTEALGDLANNIQQMVMRGQLAGAFSGNAIARVGDNILLIRGPNTPNNMMGNRVSHVEMLCLRAQTGVAVWTSSDTLPAWSIMGQPLISDDGLYACAHTDNSMDVSLLLIDPANGNLRWSVMLGSAAPTTDMRGLPVLQNPILLQHQGKVYVLTNNGALLAVDPAARQVEWAFTFPTQTGSSQRVFYNYPVPIDVIPPGAMVARGSTLYIKETGSNMLYALDLSGPALQWKRPIDQTVSLLGADDQTLYLAGTELDRIDAASRSMLWSDKLAVGSSDVRPAILGDHAYFFGRRGVQDVRLSSGEVNGGFRGYDRDSGGGAVWYIAGRLITVSNGEITAYPLDRGGRP